MQELSTKQEWAAFLNWLNILEKDAFENAYKCKKDESRDKYFGMIKAYRTIKEEITEMSYKAEEIMAELKEFKKMGGEK